MKSILMIGPGKGHNTKPFLDYFQLHNSDYNLTFLSLDDFEFNRQEYNNIDVHVFKKTLNSISLIFNVLRKQYDLIWYHGAYHWPVSLLVYFFKSAKTKINLNIWSEKLPRSINQFTIFGLVNKYILKRSDFIQCNWHSTAQLINERIDNLPVKVLPWGLTGDYFLDIIEKDLDTNTLSFIESLPEGRYKFFYAKSLTPTNRHDLIIEAVDEIINKEYKKFVVYFWLSKKTDKLKKSIKSQIRVLGLENYIKLIDLPFIPFQDMKYIWSKMDCGLQILDMDQLSVSILEPMLLKKEIIASDILSYQFLNIKAKLQFDLTKNNKSELSEKMIRKIQGETTSAEIITKRKNYIDTHQDFNKNLASSLNYFYNKM